MEVKKRKVDMKDAVDAAPLQPTAAIFNAALAGASDQVPSPSKDNVGRCLVEED